MCDLDTPISLIYKRFFFINSDFNLCYTIFFDIVDAMKRESSVHSMAGKRSRGKRKATRAGITGLYEENTRPFEPMDRVSRVGAADGGA